MRMGLPKAAAAMREAGVGGVIVPDLPPDMAGPWLAASAGIDTVFLAAPTSTPERLAKVGAMSRGFVYCVSTHRRHRRARRAARRARRARRAREGARRTLPVAVGFGVSTPEQAADGRQARRRRRRRQRDRAPAGDADGAARRSSRASSSAVARRSLSAYRVSPLRATRRRQTYSHPRAAPVARVRLCIYGAARIGEPVGSVAACDCAAESTCSAQRLRRRPGVTAWRGAATLRRRGTGALATSTGGLSLMPRRLQALGASAPGSVRLQRRACPTATASMTR